MFGYTVRPAGIADVQYVYRMNTKLLGSALSEKQSEKAFRSILFDAEQTVLLVIHSGNAVGYIHAQQVNNLYEEMHTRIVSFAVYEYYLDKKAVDELVKAVEQWSRQMLSAFVRSDCVEMKNFGYREITPGRLEKTL
ncbi:MAG: hypothetical protein K2N38_11570 [Oscillospiraceae bacterium]|nr:hypothetical protein [Oscillospiraceae bacterium]